MPLCSPPCCLPQAPAVTGCDYVRGWLLGNRSPPASQPGHRPAPPLPGIVLGSPLRPSWPGLQGSSGEAEQAGNFLGCFARRVEAGPQQPRARKGPWEAEVTPRHNPPPSCVRALESSAGRPPPPPASQVRVSSSQAEPVHTPTRTDTPAPSQGRLGAPTGPWRHRLEPSCLMANFLVTEKKSLEPCSGQG